MVLFSFFVFPDSPPFLRLFRNDTRCIKPGVDTAGHSFFKMLGASAGDEHCVAAQWGFRVFSENFLGKHHHLSLFIVTTPQKIEGFWVYYHLLPSSSPLNGYLWCSKLSDKAISTIFWWSMAGNFTINEQLNGTIIYKWEMWKIPMFDCRRVA